MPDRGKFITFEGSEGAGKSTQIRLFLDMLDKKDIAHLHCREPGGTPLGEIVRDLLKHDPRVEDMTSEAELLLFASSRAELVRKIISPALDNGKWVICDRFLDSTTVYQGKARGLPLATVQAINSFVTGPCMPDLTLYLDIEIDESHRRMEERSGQQDRMENLPRDFFERVREGYLDLARNEPKRIRIIDARGTPEDVHQRINQEIHHAIPSLLD